MEGGESVERQFTQLQLGGQDESGQEHWGRQAPDWHSTVPGSREGSRSAEEDVVRVKSIPEP